jgi:hypothetical protein
MDNRDYLVGEIKKLMFEKRQLQRKIEALYRKLLRESV